MSQLFSDSARNRRIGIALVTVTTLMFATLDASAKCLVVSLPVMQVVWMRFLTHSLFSIAVFAPSVKGDLLRWRHPRLQLLRGLMLAAMTGLNFWALQYLQLAETGAIQFSVPILIALLSAWWLGERLDAKRWLAIAIGFAGVLVIIRPGSQGFHPAILLSELNAILCALQHDDALLGQQRTPSHHATDLGGGGHLGVDACGAVAMAKPRHTAGVVRNGAGRFVRRHWPLLCGLCAPLCFGGGVGAVFVPANHLHDPDGLAGV
jgi:uncharacterized membrane protein